MVLGNICEGAVGTNGYYFTYDGQIIYVMGSGMESISNITSWRNYIDLLTNHQYGKTKFRIRFFTWWASTSPWQVTDSTNFNYDLMNWNAAYWTSTKEIISYANAKGVLVEYVLFDDCALRGSDPWAKHPFNSANSNGGMITGTGTGYGSPEFHQLYDYTDYYLFQQTYSDSWAWQKKNQWHQQKYVKKAIDELGGYNNVYWEIMNEICDLEQSYQITQVQLDYTTHWINFLSVHDPNQRLVSVSGPHADGDETNLFSLAGNDLCLPHNVNATWNPNIGIPTVIKNLLSINKPIIDDEMGWYTSQSDWKNPSYNAQKVERWTFWQSFVTQGHMSRVCWQNFNEWPIHDWLLNFSKFVSSTAFWNMSSSDSLVTNVPSGLYQNTLAKPGVEYISYFTTPVDSPDFGGGSVSIKNLPTGTYDLKFYNPRTDTYSGNTQFTQTTAGNKNISIPSFSEDMVMYISAAVVTPGITITPIVEKEFPD